MHNDKKLTITLNLNQVGIFILIGFTAVTALVAGDDFISTIKFLFQWVHSHFIPAAENYPNADYKVAALFFFSKAGGIFLTGLLVMAITMIYYGPVVGFSEAITNLIAEKNTHYRTLQEHTELQGRFNNFANHAEQHQQSQLALIRRYKGVTEDLNLGIIGARQTVHDLTNTLDQLKAISAALGNQLSPPEKTDQGGF